jgi:hypothetical protein
LRVIQSVSEACSKYGHEDSLDFSPRKKESIDLKNAKPVYKI